MRGENAKARAIWLIDFMRAYLRKCVVTYLRILLIGDFGGLE